jgi:hypothetical protein
MRSEVVWFTHTGELPVRPWPHLSRLQGGSEYLVSAVQPVYMSGNEYIAELWKRSLLTMI